MNKIYTRRNIGTRLDLQKDYRLERVVLSLLLKLNFSLRVCRLDDIRVLAAKRFRSQIGCQKAQGRISKSPAGQAQTVPSEDAKCSVSEVQQPPQPARKMEPVSRLSKLLSLSFSITWSFSSSSRAVDPSRARGHYRPSPKPK